MSKYKVFIICCFAIFILCSCSPTASHTTTSYEGIEVSSDPLQTYTTSMPFDIIMKDKKYTMTPMADYKLVAKIQSKIKYSWEALWINDISKYDLVFSWGDMADKEIDKKLQFRQESRWYYLNWDKTCPLEESYMMQHTSNNHIIAANNAVLDGVKKIHTDDIAYFEGNLVFVKYILNGQEMNWNTSLLRTDTGNWTTLRIVE